MDKVIHTVHDATWTRYNKWRVELEIKGESKRVCWLSNTQYDYLVSAFVHTKNGYSDKRATIIGSFDDDKGYYIRCRAERTKSKPKHCTPLIQPAEVAHDLRDF